MLIGDTEHFRRISGPPLVAAQVKRFHDLDCRASRPAVQAPDGSCDWSELRPFVDWMQAHGMVGVQVLGGTPAWDTDDTAEDGYGRLGGAAVPRTWDGYRACVRSFCATFSAAEVPYLSSWNEPKGPRSFDGGDAELVEMQSIVRTEAPDRRILTPSFYAIEHAREFLSECPRNLWDLLDVHLYGQTAEQLSATLDAYAALAPGCRFAITETGWQCNDQRQPDDAEQQTWRWQHMTRQQRAQEWLRVCRMCEARGDVELLMWYSLDAHTKQDPQRPLPIDRQPVYSMGDKPELLAAQRAAVERKDIMATTTTPTTAELIFSALRSKQEADGLVYTALDGTITLLGQVRAYLTTVLATAGSGGGMTADEVQALLDQISQGEEDARAAAARANGAIAANQLPSTQAPAPAPAVGAAKG